VYASTDPNLHSSLVDTSAKLPSYGPLILVDASICRGFPQGWLVPILTSGHALCLRFPGLKIRGESARTHFSGGSLEVRWVKQGGV
jgi:hypothetical protein